MPTPETGRLQDSDAPLWTFDASGNLIVAGNVYSNGVVPAPGGPLVPGPASLSLQPGALLELTGGGPVTLATVENALGDGYPGAYLDPHEIWQISGGLTVNGLPPFILKSDMAAGIGFNGVPAYGQQSGYVQVNASGDGIEVYASNPAGAPSTGIIFKGLALVGTIPGGNILHLGGGQRACGLVDSFVYNLSATANSFAVTSDTALSNNNGEDLVFSFTGGGGLAGNWAALGWGINDQTQRSNDTTLYDLRTAGGTYGVFLANGGGLKFVNYYDRSNPATAAFYNHGATRVVLDCGEDRNTAGLCHLIDANNARTIIQNRAVTQGGTSGSPTIQISAGSLEFQGACVFNTAQEIAISGGKVIIADPCTDPTNLSVVGTAGTVNDITAAKYINGNGPTLTGFTGTATTLF